MRGGRKAEATHMITSIPTRAGAVGKSKVGKVKVGDRSHRVVSSFAARPPIRKARAAPGGGT